MTTKIKTSMLIAMAVLMAITIVSCGKYKGFKKNDDGYYYKFYVTNNDSVQPQDGDMVLIDYAIRTDDSLLVHSMTRLLMDTAFAFYKGDLFDAIRIMHLGDSATFIFEADTFAHYYLGDQFPFDKKEIYVDVKLVNLLTKAELDEMEREYYKGLENMRIQDEELRAVYLEENKITDNTPSGLYYKLTKTGKGKKAEAGKWVTVHYTGKLLDGTVFDSSIGRDPISFPLGAHQVIPGWEEGIALMQEGGQCTLIIPSDLGYGENGAGSIPPYATLVFDVELISVEDMPARQAE